MARAGAVAATAEGTMAGTGLGGLAIRGWSSFWLPRRPEPVHRFPPELLPARPCQALHEEISRVCIGEHTGARSRHAYAQAGYAMRPMSVSRCATA
eukprot:CAMPEP_0181232928 /NCGR_PEP_ID=MMETSP1096-20121128/36031_1 /TAXON_ID=156174 ORGANISM="Chrysochromulina ericina, Strain CCMP281" /NCGR_SAMPLE_ID=MMETSP1096 /ASSEMBLY_ACC=CAM_ASM_000453 /LENGTH=95 /DNA_ID=CAMNT_0023327329 /DNA_START=42 /DNA_END=329 /DNA_ORIENTATION=-